MRNFIKLTLPSSRKTYYLEPDSIIGFRESFDIDGTCIKFVSGDYVEVAESPEQLITLINDADPTTPTTTERYELRFGEITTVPTSTMPKAEVIITEASSGESKVVGYIAPFRGYRFQISDEEGYDLGSSPVIASFNEAFSRLVDWDKTTYYPAIKPTLEGQIMIAINQYLSNRYGLEATNNQGAVVLPALEDYNVFNDFLDRCVEYLGLVVEKEDV